MRAALLSIGDELVLGQTVDTNSAWLSGRLAAAGVVTVEHRTVADDERDIAGAVADLAERCDLLIMTGGLGPTDDDLTREGLNAVVAPGRDLVLDEPQRRRLERWFSGQDKPMPPSNRRQACRPEPMRCLTNHKGTAPGLAGRHGACELFALPGPPREMHAMFEGEILGRFAASGEGSAIVSRAVMAYGIGESSAAEELGVLTDRTRTPLVGTTVSRSVLAARITARGPIDETTHAVDEIAREVEERWFPYAFGRDDCTLAAAVGRLASARGFTIATAESCTGGLLSRMIVDVNGASEFFVGGWTTYVNAMKTSCLGVDAGLIERVGAVSSEVAVAMARGARSRSGATSAAAITGVAGPTGGTDDKPVGTVHVAVVSGRDDEPTVDVRRFRFPGDRDEIRDRSAKTALQMVRFALMDLDQSPPLLWQRTPRPVEGTTT